ncbi:MAG: hypothetical protein JST66_16765 [Bacteroidetes bacterium]|nr:hypothetical protein [Bacteroidota bacterium]
MKTPSTRLSQDLYVNLGFLFYSIAAGDGRVASAEAERLKEEVKKHWMPLEPSRDEVGTDMAYYMDISFDHALGQHMSAQEAFERFKAYHGLEPAAFDPSTQALVMRTATAIAASRNGIGKAERGSLERLKRLFEGAQ